jgi:hypothetical protein
MQISAASSLFSNADSPGSGKALRVCGEEFADKPEYDDCRRLLFDTMRPLDSSKLWLVDVLDHDIGAIVNGGV